MGYVGSAYRACLVWAILNGMSTYLHPQFGLRAIPYGARRAGPPAHVSDASVLREIDSTSLEAVFPDQAWLTRSNSRGDCKSLRLSEASYEVKECEISRHLPAVHPSVLHRAPLPSRKDHRKLQ